MVTRQGVVVVLSVGLAALACQRKKEAVPQAQAPASHQKAKPILEVAFTGIAGIRQNQPGDPILVLFPDGRKERDSDVVSSGPDEKIPSHRVFARIRSRYVADDNRRTPSGHFKHVDPDGEHEYAYFHIGEESLRLHAPGSSVQGLPTTADEIRMEGVCKGHGINALDKHSALFQADEAYFGSRSNGKAWQICPPMEQDWSGSCPSEKIDSIHPAQEIYYQIELNGNRAEILSHDFKNPDPLQFNEPIRLDVRGDPRVTLWLGNSSDDDMRMKESGHEQAVDTHFELYYLLTKRKDHKGKLHVPYRRSRDDQRPSGDIDIRSMRGSNCPPVKF